MAFITPILERKRDGAENSSEDFQTLVSGFLSGEIKDYQMAAWLMAVACRGLSDKELAFWTETMWKSGTTFSRSSHGGDLSEGLSGKRDYWVDKHSTGGVGDKTSLILVPLVSFVAEKYIGSGQVKIPMISGRGLGHSGGTLDKLEAVPGFSPMIPMGTALELLQKNGFFMMGQTKDVAPADRLLYALRDVTGTVESIPLIVSSILSKKLSENLDGLVFDVKVGSGAFMKSRAQARTLAKKLVLISKKHGVAATALVTHMDEPLGYAIGNLLEVEEAVHYLQGRRQDPGLHKVVMSLAAEMISLASRGKISPKKARQLCEKEVVTAPVFEKFKLMFQSQGGSWNAYEQAHKEMREKLCSASVLSPRTGFLFGFDTKGIGNLLIELGGGRKVKEDRVDPLVGIEVLKKVGDRVKKGDPILNLLFRKEEERVFWISKALKLFVVKPVKKSKILWVLEKIK